MAAMDDDSMPMIKFKRRKIAHPRKPYTGASDAPALLTSTQDDAPDAAPGQLALVSMSNLPPQPSLEKPEESVPNLYEVIRNRKRPRDRMREAARKAEEKKAALTALPQSQSQAVETKADPFSDRFVRQTGQVVDADDEQMTAYVEARLAADNYREYGVPIPKHLESLVASFSRTDQTATPPASAGQAPAADKTIMADIPKSHRDNRMAAGLGKLQEIDLGPEASARNLQRIEEARRRIEGLPSPVPATPPTLQTSKPTKSQRPPKRNRRNSTDLRRDKLVEAVLSEAKLEFFEEQKPPSPPAANPGQDPDEAFYQHFRREFENQESRNQRKPALPPAAKGVKEVPKGPKLGGSRSARAAMRAQEEQAALKGRR